MGLIVFLAIFYVAYKMGELNEQEKKDGTNDCKY